MIRPIIKLISIISITFLLVFSFVGQNLIVNAQTTTPGTTASPKPADTTTPKPATPATKSDGPVIGGLKKCTVEKNETFNPTQGNEKLRDCLRDIIQLVITIAVLISVASLAGYGIQLMNPLETSGKIQGQIAQRITELAVGGLILGMFGTILATINPATLTTSKIFGDNAVATFREFIKAGQGATTAGVSKGTGATPGAGGTTSGGASDKIYTDILTGSVVDKAKVNALSPAKKAELVKFVTKYDICNDNFSNETSCGNITQISDVRIKELAAENIKSTHTTPSQLAGPVNTNKKIDDIVDNNNGNYSVIFSGATTATLVTITGAGTNPCKNPPKGAIEAGKVFVPSDCTLKLKTK